MVTLKCIKWLLLKRMDLAEKVCIFRRKIIFSNLPENRCIEIGNKCMYNKIAIKELRDVEVNSWASNQHEFHG